MRKGARVVHYAVALLFACLVCGSEADAAMYRYIDKDGTPSYTDDLQSVPEQYRKTVVIVSGELKETKRPAADKGSDVSAPAPEAYVSAVGVEAHKTPESPVLRMVLRSVAVVLVMTILYYVALVRAPHLKERRYLRMKPRTLVIAALCVVVVAMNARPILNFFGQVGSTVSQVQQRQEERGKKAAQSLKVLQGMLEGMESSAADQGGSNERSSPDQQE